MKCDITTIMECRELSDGSLSVCLPITLPGGAPVYAFVERHGRTYTATDDGETLAYARALGTGFRHRFTDGFARKIQQAGADFEEGEVITKSTSLTGVIESFICAAVSARQYIEERMLLASADDDALIETIASIIERRNPGTHIEKNVKVKGASGETYTMPMRAGKTIIYPLQPNGRATGAALRRILDVEAAGEPPPLVVLNDMESRDRAEREAAIIRSVARTALLSELEHGKGPIDLAA